MAADRLVVVVGVGALGSHVVQFLRNVEVKLRVIDFDRVEQRNVMSQFHGKPSVGKGKTQSLKDSMQFLFGFKIDTVPHKLTGDNAKELLGGAALVLDCLDNGKSRRVVQGFVREHGIPCLHGAVDGDGTFGQVTWDEGFKVDDEPSEGAKTCEDGRHLPFISTVSAFLARSAQIFLDRGQKISYVIHPGGVQRI
jgi:molybdopterin/thiamine biosynthesis adenylyltransferase